MIADRYGWLLDVYPGRGGAVVWLLGEDGERHGLWAPFPVSFFAAGLGVANMVPILFSAAGNHPNLPSANAISIVTMVGYCGILVAPASIGFIAEHAGYRMTYAGLSLLLIVVALLAARAADADGTKAVAPAAPQAA